MRERRRETGREREGERAQKEREAGRAEIERDTKRDRGREGEEM